MGRLDWWNIKAEHTPYEWEMQKALYLVEPWGEDRADLRMARNTLLLRSALASEKPTQEELDEWQRLCIEYLKVNETPEQVVGPAMQRKLLEG